MTLLMRNAILRHCMLTPFQKNVVKIVYLIKSNYLVPPKQHFVIISLSAYKQMKKKVDALL